MFSTIVVGTDGSDRAGIAVDHAAGLAAKWGATVHLVSAAKDSGTPADLAPQVALARDHGVTVETHQAPGNPVAVILDVAGRVGADLIVVGNRGMEGSRRLLGSVPNNVAHHSSCAVLIVPTGA